MGYFKGAAADWAMAATANGANNQITTWAGNNNTSLAPRMKAKFASETKQNKWYQELMTTRQTPTESVDDYSLRFKRLLRKVNPDLNNLVIPAGLQIRMFLFGLSPALTPLVSTAAPATLDLAIERACLVEAGYNYTPAAKSLTAVANETEVDELTRKIERLSLNYATLASALTSQSASNNNDNQRQNRQNNRSQRQNDNRTCYTCNRTGHIARNCPNRNTNSNNNQNNRRQTRRTRFAPANNHRSFNYLDSYYEEEESDYYEDEIEAEVYVTSRSGKQYTKPKTRRIIKQSESLQEETLRRPTVLDEQADSEPEIVQTRRARRKLQPAPIEDVTEYNVAEYIRRQPSGLTVGQAAYLISDYRNGLAKSTRRTRPKEANYSDSEGQQTTAAKCEVYVGRNPVMAIVDSGAATSLISKPLMKKLGLEPNKASNMIIVNVNGNST